MNTKSLGVTTPVPMKPRSVSSVFSVWTISASGSFQST
jgi:hypothetical protein